MLMKITGKLLLDMLKKIQYIFGLVVMAAALTAAPVVFAETSNGSTGDGGSTQPNTSTNDDKDINQPLTEAQKTELQTRLTKQKTDLKIKLTDVETKKLKLKCQPAQAVVKNVEARVHDNAPTRTKAYQDITDKLNGIIAKLQSKEIDVTELKAEMTVLQGKITTFNTDLAAAKQAMNDVRNVDCISDPAAFEAALQTARTARDKVVKDASDIKAYITSTIKPSLEKIRGQLEAQEKNANNGSQQHEGSN